MPSAITVTFSSKLGISEIRDAVWSPHSPISSSIPITHVHVACNRFDRHRVCRRNSPRWSQSDIMHWSRSESIWKYQIQEGMLVHQKKQRSHFIQPPANFKSFLRTLRILNDRYSYLQNLQGQELTLRMDSELKEYRILCLWPLESEKLDWFAFWQLIYTRLWSLIHDKYAFGHPNAHYNEMMNPSAVA